MATAQTQETQPITPESLLPVMWQQINVITTELLAKLYGATSQSIRKNFARNSQRFEEGKHFHKLNGTELAKLRATFGHVQISSKTRSLILWTVRGAARHAKMLETDQAWEVFEQLEDHYFHRCQSQQQESPSALSTVFDREPLLAAAVAIVVHHHVPFPVAYQAMTHFAGANRFKVMTKHQVAETKKFVERFLMGTDTRADWQRIERNRETMAGPDRQLALTGLLPPWSNIETMAGSV